MLYRACPIAGRINRATLHAVQRLSRSNPITAARRLSESIAFTPLVDVSVYLNTVWPGDDGMRRGHSQAAFQKLARPIRAAGHYNVL